MRIINFSADGIESAARKGFFDWLSTQDADIVCIQDLRARESDLKDKIYFPEGYFAYFLDSPDRKNGVAIYTRKLPKAVMTGLGFNDFDQEARYIQADFEEISVSSILVPETTLADPASVERKLQFLNLLYAHLEKISNKRRTFIFAGNWHIAHSVDDIQQDTDDNQPGFSLKERRWIDDVSHRLGYVDAFREANTDNDEFSWWPLQPGTNGRRLDFQLVSADFKSRVEYAVIYKKQAFSSHAPVIIDYDFPLGEDSF